jgi:hypothetical protein
MGMGCFHNASIHSELNSWHGKSIKIRATGAYYGIEKPDNHLAWFTIFIFSRGTGLGIKMASIENNFLSSIFGQA